MYNNRNQPDQTVRLTKHLNIETRCAIYTIKEAINKTVDMTAWMRKLICTHADRISHIERT